MFIEEAEKVLVDFIKEVLFEAKTKAKKNTSKKKRAAKKGRKKSKRKKKRPGRKEYYQNINKKGQKAMAKEINKCSSVGKPKGWKMPKSCYDEEWEADKKKYRTKK